MIQIRMGVKRDGGFCYCLVDDGTVILTGWRAGTIAEIEVHLRKVVRCYTIRSRGEIIKLYRNGQRRQTKNGRAVHEKEQVDDRFLSALDESA